MKVHEYQARQLLQEAGVPVPPSHVAETVDADLSLFEELMGAVPTWAEGCIYGTDGWEGKRYRK